MPELPEVETTRRSFAQRIAGATVTDVRLGKPLRWPLGCTPASLRGRRVGQATRRGKYLWLPVGEGGLLLHLGMSGSLAFGEQLAPPGAHDHFDLITDRGTLRLTDPRRFGAVLWSRSLDVPPAATRLGGLGLEPFDPALARVSVNSTNDRRVLDELSGGRLIEWQRSCVEIWVQSDVQGSRFRPLSSVFWWKAQVYVEMRAWWFTCEGC